MTNKKLIDYFTTCPTDDFDDREEMTLRDPLLYDDNYYMEKLEICRNYTDREI